MSLLEVRKLSKRFGGIQALTEVSLEVVQGKIVGVAGPNGAGKTTLFNCISGYSPFVDGTVHFDDHDIGNQRPHKICRLGLARTFQIVRPFRDMTVLENAMVGAYAGARGQDAQRAALGALAALGMLDMADLDAGSLGTADQRRLEIARAVATGPKLLLLDETMAGLTGSEAQDMCNRIRALRDGGLSILMIEHSVPIMRSLCDEIAVLNFGTILGQGPPEEILQTKIVQEAYLGITADADTDSL